MIHYYVLAADYSWLKKADVISLPVPAAENRPEQKIVFVKESAAKANPGRYPMYELAAMEVASAAEVSGGKTGLRNLEGFFLPNLAKGPEEFRMRAATSE